MRVSRLMLSCIGLSVVLSVAVAPMIEIADGQYCCPPPRCAAWSYMIYGGIEILGKGQARISIDKGPSIVLPIDPDVQKPFTDDRVTKDFGFVVLDGDMTEGKAHVTGFVTADRHKELSSNDRAIGSAQSVIKFFNQQVGDYISSTQQPKM